MPALDQLDKILNAEAMLAFAKIALEQAEEAGKTQSASLDCVILWTGVARLFMEAGERLK